MLPLYCMLKELTPEIMLKESNSYLGHHSQNENMKLRNYISNMMTNKASYTQQTIAFRLPVFNDE